MNICTLFSSAQKPYFQPELSNVSQVAQTSALTDRQVEERRVLDLENAVKSVSLSEGPGCYVTVTALCVTWHIVCFGA